MTEREEIEQAIRTLIALDGIDSITFSNRLYQAGSGLFTRLGRTKEERAEILQSELWTSARQRLADLEKIDLARYRRHANAVQSAGADIAPVPIAG